MTKHPILFSGAMVRAILDGRKTQTRRVAKFGDNVRACDGVAKGFLPGAPNGFVIPCPYGKPGDRLWVRETWCPATWGSYEPRKEIPKSAAEALIQFRADYRDNSSADYDGHWKPGIHLPRWASRITLEITKVRVERLFDMNEDDAKAEGIQAGSCVIDHCGPHYLGGFISLWDSINAKRDGGIYAWEKNPWVWVIEFARVSAEAKKGNG